MFTQISHLKHLSHSDGNITLHYLKYENNSDGYEIEVPKFTSPFSLSQGVEIAAYKEAGVLKATIAYADPEDFTYYTVGAEILFEGSNNDQDIIGGILKRDLYNGVSDTLRLKGLGNVEYNRKIGALERFHISIIGVDDIRAAVGEPPNFIETYLLEEQRIFLKLISKEIAKDEFKDFLQIRYKKRL